MHSRFNVYVIGMRVENYIGVEAGDDDYNCNTQPCNAEKYILFCVAELPYRKRRKLTITLWNEGGWCCSGYTTATWGGLRVEEVDNFGPITHRPKSGRPIRLDNTYYDTEYVGASGICFEKPSKEEMDILYPDVFYDDIDVINNVFSYSAEGGDAYYPSGYSSVNMDLFTEYARNMKDRPVWIFSGDSGTGKSTLAYYLSKRKEVFETDSLKDGELPETIWADIVVVGNKYKFSTADIASHLPKGTEVIAVNFFKGYENE